MEQIQQLIMVCMVTMAAMAAPMGAHFVICEDIIIPTLSPCLGYLTAPGPAQPSAACCSASLSVASLALLSQANLQGVCTCLESVAGSGKFKINFENAKAITKLCNLPIDVPIDHNVDCKTLTLPKPPTPVPTPTPPDPAPIPAPAPSPSYGPAHDSDELTFYNFVPSNQI